MLSGSPRNHPVIETTLHLVAATAPTLHPLFAAAVDVDADAALSGFNDLLPKPWAERFREMQANGGGIEIKALRFAQGKAIIVVGAGKLSLNEHGKLDGVIERRDRRHRTNRSAAWRRSNCWRRASTGLSGSPGTAAQGLNALDQLIPGLGGALRETANAGIIDNLKKMGQPTDGGKPGSRGIAAAFRRRREFISACCGSARCRRCFEAEPRLVPACQPTDASGTESVEAKYGLMSSSGVSSRQSSPTTVSVLPSMRTSRATETAIGLGRTGERSAKVPRRSV